MWNLNTTLENPDTQFGHPENQPVSLRSASRFRSKLAIHRPFCAHWRIGDVRAATLMSAQSERSLPVAEPKNQGNSGSVAISG